MVETLRLKLKEQKGFTLIELLAVIVILGIIAAIAIPAISNVISKSQVKSQAQEGIQIINAARMYVANEGFQAEITRAELMGEYLDRVDAPDLDGTTETNDFKVTLTEVGTSGKYTYSLVNHPATAKATDKTMDEQKLIEAAK